MTTITRAMCSLVRDDANAALAAVAKKYGLIISVGSARYSDTEINFKMQATVGTASAIAAVIAGTNPKDVKAATDYTTMGHLYGLKPEWLNKSFVCVRTGSTLRIVGLLPNKRVNNVFVSGAQGGKYIMPASDVIASFAGR
jgi:hypothetical protein